MQGAGALHFREVHNLAPILRLRLRPALVLLNLLDTVHKVRLLADARHGLPYHGSPARSPCCNYQQMRQAAYQLSERWAVQHEAFSQQLLAELLAGAADGKHDVCPDGVIVAGHRCQNLPAAVCCLPERLKPGAFQVLRESYQSCQRLFLLHANWELGSISEGTIWGREEAQDEQQNGSPALHCLCDLKDNTHYQQTGMTGV